MQNIRFLLVCSVLIISFDFLVAEDVTQGTKEQKLAERILHLERENESLKKEIINLRESLKFVSGNLSVAEEHIEWFKENHRRHRVVPPYSSFDYAVMDFRQIDWRGASFEKVVEDLRMHIRNSLPYNQDETIQAMEDYLNSLQLELKRYRNTPSLPAVNEIRLDFPEILKPRDPVNLTVRAISFSDVLLLIGDILSISYDYKDGILTFRPLPHRLPISIDELSSKTLLPKLQDHRGKNDPKNRIDLDPTLMKSIQEWFDDEEIFLWTEDEQTVFRNVMSSMNRRVIDLRILRVSRIDDEDSDRTGRNRNKGHMPLRVQDFETGEVLNLDKNKFLPYAFPRLKEYRDPFNVSFFRSNPKYEDPFNVSFFRSNPIQSPGLYAKFRLHYFQGEPDDDDFFEFTLPFQIQKLIEHEQEVFIVEPHARGDHLQISPYLQTHPFGHDPFEYDPFH